jgi:Protein of unknown function (DUF3014)
VNDPELRISPEDRPLFHAQRGTRSPLAVAIVTVLALAALAVGAYLYWASRQAQPAPVAASEPPATPQAKTEPRIEHPIEAATPAAPLPSLADSDPALASALTTLFGKASFEQLFVPDALVRHFVATVDNLPRTQVAVRLLPVKPVPGPMRTSGDAATLIIGADNAARYTPYVRAMDAVDSGRLVALYVQFYPLFQQSYAEQGYPSRYFNDRVFEVIDHLLATPEVAGPIALTQPKVLYEYADPNLQELSAGQKILLRMGPANEARVKAKLREIRKLLHRE